ncbi:hypothetical protein B0J11DRAFT_178059 [Dendryphion nanum]|uniref:Uncharacterized protein n=1 Tax=Dendryphion nanum TaxID=256645 RepID=A0A9P9IZG7_9PLEO|nr:hypothetical protein B0J11DRAFT_178059 [Dendryphion nanum]
MLMDGAERLGERLLGEVEGEGLSSLLNSLRELTTSQKDQKAYFGIPELDALIRWPTISIPQPGPASLSALQHQIEPSSTLQPSLPIPQESNATAAAPPAPPSKKPTQPPLLELLSPPPSHHPSPSGKTSLLYLITTLTILPPTFLTTPLHGKNSTIVIFDPLSHFHIPRLTEIVTHYITTALRNHDKEFSIDNDAKSQICTLVKTSLTHVHIVRPQSWSALLEALQGLEAYLFDPKRHESAHRAVRAVVLEDLQVWRWGVLAEKEKETNANANANAMSKASSTLTPLLTSLSRTLQTAIITTSQSPSAAPLRPAIPLSLSGPGPGLESPVTRLVVTRVEVLKFGEGMGVGELEREREMRREVVRRGRFAVEGMGAEIGGRERARGFVFRVGRGVGVEGEEENV